MLEIIDSNRMLRDETLLDIAGALLLVIAAAAFATGYLNEVPIPKLLEGVSPLLLGGVAAIAGTGAILAFFKNR